MASKFVYLRLSEKATVFSDPVSGLKLVRDVPAKITRTKFEQAINSKSSTLKERLGMQVVQIDEATYDKLVDAHQKTNQDSEKTTAKALRGSLKKLEQRFGKESVASAIEGKSEKTIEDKLVDPDDEDENEDEDEDENDFEDEEDEEDELLSDKTKAELAQFIIDHDEDNELDVKALKKKSHADLVEMAESLQ